MEYRDNNGAIFLNRVSNVEPKLEHAKKNARLSTNLKDSSVLKDFTYLPGQKRLIRRYVYPPSSLELMFYKNNISLVLDKLHKIV